MINQKGFSLVEMMIAISLGALMIASVGAVYISNKTTYNVQQALSRLQENGRFALYTLARELRMAGYSGCANLSKIPINNITGNSTLDFTRPIEGFEGSSGTYSPSLPANLTGLPINNSDVIVVRSASPQGVQVRQPMNQETNPLLVYDRLGLSAGDTVIVTDCSVGDIFTAGSNSNATAITHPSSNNTTNRLSTLYDMNAEVMFFNYYAFLIANTGRVNANNEAITALVRVDSDGNRLEIAEGVEQMEITFGVDTTGDNATDSFMTATQVQASNNWDNVLSAQVRLLMVTPENINDKPVNYTFNNNTVTPTDRKLRRELDLFITFRNRGMPS